MWIGAGYTQLRLAATRSTATEPAGRRLYKVKSLAAIHHGTCLIQPIQMARERARARITAQLSRDTAGDGLLGFCARLISSAICDSPLVRVLLNFLAQKQKARSTAGGLLAGLESD